MEMELSFKNMPLPARVNYLASKTLMTWTLLKRMIAVTGSTVGDYEYKATLARKLEKLAIEIEEEE